MDTNGLLDNRNLELWNSLSATQEIEICKEQRLDYLAFSQNNKTIIYVPYNNLNSSSFTHELLHIYLRTKKVFIGGGLKLSIKDSEILSKILSSNLIDHIGNCLDHIKMLPEFIKLGFDEINFLSDYSDNKLTKEDTIKIKAHFVKTTFSEKVYNAQAIDLFIGKYFAAISCPNKSYNYQENLQEMYKLDPELFDILEKFLAGWNNFDYNDTDLIRGDYNSILHEFIMSLEKWTIGKTIK